MHESPWWPTSRTRSSVQSNRATVWQAVGCGRHSIAWDDVTHASLVPWQQSVVHLASAPSCRDRIDCFTVVERCWWLKLTVCSTSVAFLPLILWNETAAECSRRGLLGVIRGIAVADRIRLPVWKTYRCQRIWKVLGKCQKIGRNLWECHVGKKLFIANFTYIRRCFLASCVHVYCTRDVTRVGPVSYTHLTLPTIYSV